MTTYDTSMLLTLIACIIRLYGFRQSTDLNGRIPTTYERLRQTLTLKKPDARVTDEDRYLAYNAALWAQIALSPLYASLVQNPTVSLHFLREAIYIVYHYTLMLEQRAPESKHLGAKGELLACLVTCYTSKTIPTRNGTVMEYWFRDEKNNLIQWTTKHKATDNPCRVGLPYRLTGTISAHRRFHDCAVTVIEHGKTSIP